MLKPSTKVMRNYALVLGLLVFLILVLPVSPVATEQYDLTHTQYRILLFLIYLPLAGIWYAAFYGYQKLQQYAEAIERTPEGKSFEYLARGAKWLAWGLPIPTLFSLLINAIGNSNPSFHEEAIILSGYVSLIFPLVAFTIMSTGSRALVERAKIRISGVATRNIQLLFVLVGVLYCFLVFRNLDLNSLSASNNPYFLPVWLLVITIIIPYLYAWFMGLLTAFDIVQVAKRTKGIFYRQALQLLASGVGVVIVSLIASQYLRTAVPRTGRVSLNFVLVLVYLLLSVMAVGYILIALGAKKLKKIEEA